ncbi:ABC transporter permease [bacterium]|nr:MAG: ABC transporter permease [bacterium]
MRPVVAFLTFVGETAMILGDAIHRAPRRPVEWKESLNQMAFVGVASVPIVALTAFFSGAVLSLYLTVFLRQYGAQTFVGATVGLTATREIGPVIAGIMVSARAGSAMAAQIGTMAVTEQIDALRMLGVHPTNYLVIPRLLAGILMVPILALVAIWMAVIGGMLVASTEGLSPSIFLQSVQQYVHPMDIVKGIMKGPFFGLIVALVACQQGLRTKNGAVGVGRSTTNAVVISMVLVYVANFLLARVMYR